MEEGVEVSLMSQANKTSENVAWKGDKPTEIVKKRFKDGTLKPGDKVVDIGSGFGRNANWLASKGVDITAININDEELKEAKEKADKLNVEVNYLHADAVDLPLDENSFDVALDLGCSHMIPDKEAQEKAETEVARVVKPGGYLIYFGFSKNHPNYINKPGSPMFKSLEDVQAMYGDDFEILSHEEVRWKIDPKENAKYPEHVGLNVVMRRKSE